MRTVRNSPVTGLAGQFVLLAVLAATVGLGVVGWLVGLAHGLAQYGLLRRGLRLDGAPGLRPADRVTLARAVLVGGVTALAADVLAGGQVPAAVPVSLAGVALALDWVDGQVARRTGTASAFGARFDMEVDAFLILVLSAYVAPAVGGWALAIGAMRYAFVAASWPLPWLRGSLPARQWRKVVAAVQGVALVGAAAGVLPGPLDTVLVAAALALLVESFTRDVWWLWRHRAGAGSLPRPGHPARPLPHSATATGRPATSADRPVPSAPRPSAPAGRPGAVAPAAPGTPARHPARQAA
ncbi:CDP-alcohol phosphatidyltransferase family protein [Micromonospora sp. PLK6-60]|uniref:CDP-alcohol phosphatidyltransferase family protein n=1 Tax=Micromonospora sp. PLK6-60 TaxID=2873383 RepID=UPI001CA72E79|nr:CDP-alcohol phosphatidyltransferase family protein [Micromonospora sp. PLK6-60]MBY8870426.1 CDP-alcohol phosphatidyltransferase family protein [Micromonospora sp. PLK6-60]